MRDKIQKLFMGYCCDDTETKKIIGAIYRQFDYLIDPHTAVGFSALGQVPPGDGGTRRLPWSPPPPVPSNSVTMCSPLWGSKSRPRVLDILDQLSQVTGEPVPAPLAALRDKKPRFHEAVEKDHMVDAVLEMLRPQK